MFSDIYYVGTYFKSKFEDKLLSKADKDVMYRVQLV